VKRQVEVFGVTTCVIVDSRYNLGAYCRSPLLPLAASCAPRTVAIGLKKDKQAGGFTQYVEPGGYLDTECRALFRQMYLCRGL